VTLRPKLPKLFFSLVAYSFLIPLALPAFAQTEREVIAVLPRNFSPHYIVTPDKPPTGFAIDVMNAVAKRSGLTVRYQVKDTWLDVHSALKSGEADLVPNMGITDERKALFNFTSPVETLPVSIFTRSSTHDIQGVEDLTGKKVAVVSTNVALFLLRDRKGIELIEFVDIQNGLFALLSGDVDAFIFPETVIMNLAQNAGISQQITVARRPLIEIKRAIAVNKRDPELRDRLEAAVQEFVRSKEYRSIYTKWHGKPLPFWRERYMTLALSLFFLATVIMAGFLFVSVRNTRKLRAEIAQHKTADL